MTSADASAYGPLLEAVASGQTVSIAYRDAADLQSKRVSFGRRAGRCGFRVEFRCDAMTLAIRRAPQSGVPTGTILPFTARRPPPPEPAQPAPGEEAPDTLSRLADQMAREIALEATAVQRPPQRVWPQRGLQTLPPALDGAREPALVCYVARGARQCGQCQRWGVLHYSVITNACMVTGTTYRMGSQRHVLCPACLSGLPHRMLF